MQRRKSPTRARGGGVQVVGTNFCGVKKVGRRWSLSTYGPGAASRRPRERCRLGQAYPAVVSGLWHPDTGEDGWGTGSVLLGLWFLPGVCRNCVRCKVGSPVEPYKTIGPLGPPF